MKPKYIAHRGYSQIETENTINSFIEAGKNSYFNAIECDIHVTKDGEFVVHHDFDTKRIAKTKVILKDTKLDELNKINLLNIKTNKLDENYKIPTLKDFIEVCKKYDKQAVIELKPMFTTNQIKRLVDFINIHEYLENTIFISFDLRNLILIRDYNQDVKIQLLLDYFSNNLIEICKTLKMDLNFRRDIPTKDLIKTLNDNNIKVNAWTVNNNEDKIKLTEMNIDFITTDNIDEDDK